MSTKENPVVVFVAGGALHVPNLPNYIKIRNRSGSEEMIAVAALTDDEIKLIGQRWTIELLEHARNKRKKEL